MYKWALQGKGWGAANSFLKTPVSLSPMMTVLWRKTCVLFFLHNDSVVKGKLCPFFPASVFSSIAHQAIIPGIAAQKVELDWWVLPSCISDYRVATNNRTKNLRFENIRPNLCEFLLLLSTSPFLFSILLFHLFLQPQSKKEIVSSPWPVQATTSLVLLILPVLPSLLVFSVTLPLFHPSPWAIKHTQVSLISVIVRAFSKPTVLSLSFLPYQSPRTTFSLPLLQAGFFCTSQTAFFHVTSWVTKQRPVLVFQPEFFCSICYC